ncbi:Uncharacterized protein Adt_49013 [Abeliophyllum distichum]|uniref:Uncharacterized protein n=1 Tax=Abeliophyllum distichum TaxID=126358 RepID=A0ABD1NQW3_9LAMI
MHSNVVVVVPGVAVNSKKMRLQTRKKASAQVCIKKKNYAKQDKVNPSKRAPNICSNDDAVVPVIALNSEKMTLPPRKATNSDTTLAGSPLENDGRYSDIPNQQMEHMENDQHLNVGSPLENDGRYSDIPNQQMEHMENDQHPNSPPLSFHGQNCLCLFVWVCCSFCFYCLQI